MLVSIFRDCMPAARALPLQLESRVTVWLRCYANLLDKLCRSDPAESYPRGTIAG